MNKEQSKLLVCVDNFRFEMILHKGKVYRSKSIDKDHVVITVDGKELKCKPALFKPINIKPHQNYGLSSNPTQYELQYFDPVLGSSSITGKYVVFKDAHKDFLGISKGAVGRAISRSYEKTININGVNYPMWLIDVEWDTRDPLTSGTQKGTYHISVIKIATARDVEEQGRRINNIARPVSEGMENRVIYSRPIFDSRALEDRMRDLYGVFSDPNQDPQFNRPDSF